MRVINLYVKIEKKIAFESVKFDLIFFFFKKSRLLMLLQPKIKPKIQHTYFHQIFIK